MKVADEIIEKVNPFIMCIPRSCKSLISNSEAKTLKAYNSGEDEDMPDFSENIPITFARATVQYKKKLEDESIYE